MHFQKRLSIKNFLIGKAIFAAAISLFLLSVPYAARAGSKNIPLTDRGNANGFNADKIIKDLNLFGKTQGEDKLYYFFSFSMPMSSLETVIPQLKKAGAIMVLRGMKDDSMKETAKALMELDGRYGVKVNIDPPLYRRLGIDRVPALAYVKGECSSCGNTPPEKFYTVYGDVSLDYALERIAKEDHDAERYLEKLRTGWFEKNQTNN
ncbi:MAG: type-F conjugative transfer system pilin assembly protein TrbC [Deltaproteobacteria bacterium GWC2_56_8]|nr:MAG: type-F conjugative transfer system pilin assembly protein TrbC [Deltaproteobacteria bacterium GWC2_56_8]